MRFFLFSFLFFTSLSYAQQSEIIAIKSTDRILRGELGEDNDITLYLRVAQRSDNVGYIFSVSGWYQYNKIGVPIPLVGIWTGSEVHLFVSDDEKFKKNLLDFIYEGKKGKQYIHNFIYNFESFTSQLPSIKERFHLKIEQHRIQGDWKSKGKRFWVSLNSSQGKILNEVKYLTLPNGNYFDLENLGIPARAGYKIVARANQGKHMILQYSYQANLNYNGRCGGAETSGKVALKFDDQYRLKQYTDAQLENCYRDLSVEKQTKVSETVTKYKTYNYNESKSETYLVNTKKAIILRVKDE